FVKRRIQLTLSGQVDRQWLSVWDLARLAGLDGIPSGEVHTVVTELVHEGAAEGLRGPRGWSRVRGSVRRPALDAEVHGRTARAPMSPPTSHITTDTRCRIGLPR